MTWIIKDAEDDFLVYLADGGWSCEQREALRFRSPRTAREAADREANRKDPVVERKDMRIVRLVPKRKTDDEMARTNIANRARLEEREAICAFLEGMTFHLARGLARRVRRGEHRKGGRRG